jgi:hypothetical protein
LRSLLNQAPIYWVVPSKQWKVTHCFRFGTTEFEFSKPGLYGSGADQAALAFCAIKLLYLELQNAQA